MTSLIGCFVISVLGRHATADRLSREGCVNNHQNLIENARRGLKGDRFMAIRRTIRPAVRLFVCHVAVGKFVGTLQKASGVLFQDRHQAVAWSNFEFRNQDQTLRGKSEKSHPRPTARKSLPTAVVSETLESRCHVTKRGAGAGHFFPAFPRDNSIVTADALTGNS